MISLLTSAMRGSVSLAALTTLPSSLVPDLVPSITSGAWHGVSLLVIHKYDLNICFSLPLYVPHHVGHSLDDAQLGLDQTPGHVHPRLHGVAELLVQVLGTKVSSMSGDPIIIPACACHLIFQQGAEELYLGL